jgi:hypothetical protein
MSNHANHLYTLPQLRELRLGCLVLALRAYRFEHDDLAAVHESYHTYWAGERLFWTARAFHYQGEILARTDRQYQPLACCATGKTGAIQ